MPLPKPDGPRWVVRIMVQDKTPGVYDRPVYVLRVRKGHVTGDPTKAHKFKSEAAAKRCAFIDGGAVVPYQGRQTR